MTKINETIFGYEKYPPFTLASFRFPQKAFIGRWLHFLDVIDPRTLLASQKELDGSLKLLDDFKHDRLPRDVSRRQLWEAKKVVQATFHPDTGHKIFMPFRMAGYVPFGTPMVVGLLLPNPSMSQIIFWQWLNQSHNACVNYANRNATKETPTIRFVRGYAGAVSTALSIAVGLTTLLKRADRFAPATRMLVQRFVPLPAVCCASTCNALLMRWHEIGAGIEVLDSKGNVVGTSKQAAKRAVRDTALTRAFLPMPIFLFPPIMMTLLEKTRWVKRFPKLGFPLNVLCCTFSFGMALPVAIALFPQVSQIARHDVEADLQNRTNEPVLFYNKGL